MEVYKPRDYNGDVLEAGQFVWLVNDASGSFAKVISVEDKYQQGKVMLEFPGDPGKYTSWPSNLKIMTPEVATLKLLELEVMHGQEFV